ncbi:MAG TPA: thioredoxin domain-containing protein [Caulobacteraceae bacterium]|nr:thioredoxin domain-containing protein [Caulobacteraceae bacterium]
MSMIAVVRRVALLIGCLALGLAPAARAQLMALTPEGSEAVLADPATPFAGKAGADVTVVEYLDFNCPYCRKAAATLGQLLAADPKVRILYKDWPIFGDVSAYAARAALAAHWQGRYIAAHDILIDSPARLASETQVRDRLVLAGVDLGQLDRDLLAHREAIEAILARNADEARALGFAGTPGLVIGSFVLPGAVGLNDMRTLVDASRHPQAIAGHRS